MDEEHTIDTRELRARLGLSQRQFAQRYHITYGTLLRWERGRSIPSGAAATLLRLISYNPLTIANLLAQINPEAPRDPLR